MTKLTQWLKVTPLTTLFLGGTQSLYMGDVHLGVSRDLPMPHTLVGALRTAMLFHQGKRPEEFVDQGFPKDTPFGRLMGAVDKPGFEVLGPLLAYGDHILLPCPLNLMSSQLNNHAKAVRLSQAAPASEGLLSLGLQSHLQDLGLAPVWASCSRGGTPEPLGDFLITSGLLPLLKQGDEIEVEVVQKEEDLNKIDGAQPQLVKKALLYDKEYRTGVGLEWGRRLGKRGHLFTLEHVRYRSGVSLILGVLSESGDSLWEVMPHKALIQLGGENRLATCESFPWQGLTETPGNRWFSLGPVLAEKMDRSRLFALATGKVFRVGGWMMKTDPKERESRGFHRPLKGWYPAGCVAWTKAQDSPGMGWMAF